MRRIATTFFALALLATGAIGADAASGGPTNLTLATGSLSVSGAAPGNFSATPTGADQNAYATLGTYQVTDQRGSGVGWRLTFQATAFAAGSLLMPPPTVSCAVGTSCNGKASPPTVSIAANTALDSGSAVTVASAGSNKGMGTYNFAPGTIGTGGLQLTVPGSAYATTYHSMLTVSSVSGP